MDTAATIRAARDADCSLIMDTEGHVVLLAHLGRDGDRLACPSTGEVVWRAKRGDFLDHMSVGQIGEMGAQITLSADAAAANRAYLLEAMGARLNTVAMIIDTARLGACRELRRARQAKDFGREGAWRYTEEELFRLAESARRALQTEWGHIADPAHHVRPADLDRCLEAPSESLTPCLARVAGLAREVLASMS